MKKLTGILIIILVLGFSANVLADDFTDVPSTHWAYESIQWGVGKGLVVGYDDGSYKPSYQITEEEFVTVLARYTKLEIVKGDYWSQPYYDAILKYNLPLNGHKDIKAKKTGLSRGQIARIVAAKNGFNLDERQAVYYMYENDLSSGLLSNELSFDSYGVTKTVDRAQIPAFFKKIADNGHTTFMGKQSNTQNPDEIGGIAGVSKDTTEITDKMFNDLAKDKGIINPEKGTNTPNTGTKGSKTNPIVLTGNNKEDAKLQNAYAKINGYVVPYTLGHTDYEPLYGLVIQTGLLSKWQGGTSGFRDKDLFYEGIADIGLLDDNQLKQTKKFIDDYHGLKGTKLMEQGIKAGQVDTVIKGKDYDINLVAPGTGEIGILVYEKGNL